MIKWLRHKKTQRFVVIGAACLIIPGFLLFGVSLDGLGGSKVAGSIGKKKVSTQAFIDNYNALRRELELFHQIDPNLLSAQADFEELTWQRILLVHEAKNRNIKISNTEVIEWLQTQKVFFNKGESFDPAFYDQVLKQYLRVEPRSFEEDVRDFMALQKVRDNMRGDADITDDKIRELFNSRFVLRDIDYLTFLSTEISEVPEVTDEELEQYYDWIKDRLLSPEMIQVSIVVLPDGVTAPADGDVLHELIHDTGSRTPFFGRNDAIPNIGIAPELSQAIFALSNPGDHTEWLAHDGKQYLFELIIKQKQAPMSLDDARNILINDLTQKKKSKALKDEANQFYTSAKEKGFESAADDLGKTITALDGYQPDQEINGIGQIPGINKALSELAYNEISQPIRIQSGYALFNIRRIGDPIESLWDSKKDELQKELKFNYEVEVFEANITSLFEKLSVNTKAMQGLFPKKYELLAQQQAAVSGPNPIPTQ
ncbi:MAG: hypothetical protein ACI9CF_000180 [Candidatus Omnitrophota bacterium]|jgi:hypothetical protein